MILLSPEEIQLIKLSDYPSIGKHSEAIAIAKAQAKKVAEWLEGYRMGEMLIAEDAVNAAPYFIIPPSEYQALLKEVE